MSYELDPVEHRQLLERAERILGVSCDLTDLIEGILIAFTVSRESIDSCFANEISKLDFGTSDANPAWEAKYELGRLYVKALPILTVDERQAYINVLNGIEEPDSPNPAICGLITKLRITYVATTTSSSLIFLDDYRGKTKRVSSTGIHGSGTREAGGSGECAAET